MVLNYILVGCPRNLLHLFYGIHEFVKLLNSKYYNVLYVRIFINFKVSEFEILSLRFILEVYLKIKQSTFHVLSCVWNQWENRFADTFGCLVLKLKMSLQSIYLMLKFPYLRTVLTLSLYSCSHAFALMARIQQTAWLINVMRWSETAAVRRRTCAPA